VCAAQFLTRPKAALASDPARTLAVAGGLLVAAIAWLAAADSLIPTSVAGWPRLALEVTPIVALGLVGTYLGLRFGRDRQRTLDALGRSESLLRAIVDTTPFPTMSFDRERKLTFWNPAAEKLFGWRSDEVLGGPFPAQMPDDEHVEAGERIDRTLAGAVISGDRVHRRARDGRMLTLEIHAAALHDRHGRPMGYAGQMVDVTEQERSRAQLSQLAAAIGQTVDAVVIVDSTGHLAYVNPAYEQQSGYSAAELVGRHHDDIAAPTLGDAVHRAVLEAARDGRTWLGEVDQLRPDRSSIRVQMSMTPVHDQVSGAVNGFVVVQRDVTELRAIEADLALESRIRTVLSEAVHEIGPTTTLQRASQAICDELASVSGVDVAAIGVFLDEDEIDVVAASGSNGLPGLIGRRLPPHRARRIREQVAGGPWAVPWQQLDADGAWGTALTEAGLRAFAFGPIVHGDHADGGAVIGTRDEQFARALVDKLPGIVAFGTTSSAMLGERLHASRQHTLLHREIAQLVAARGFHPVFQPIVDIATREVAGYEGLTRFDDGRSPDQTFSDAWSVGLGNELEFATLETAIEAARRLPAGRWLDLNVSPRSLLHSDRLRAIIAAADRPVVIEITEHEPIADYDAVRQALKAVGADVRVAVDDAGAGVANFNHIVELGADFVKLDTGLVSHVNANLARQALVVGMRHFARATGCRLVAEGVETEDEARTLAEIGVDFGQGYLFGRPAAAGR
jgi:PAS domain S-box-containing protein